MPEGRAQNAAYLHALERLKSRINVERTHPAHLGQGTLKLDRMRALMAELGHPEQHFRSIHVAGSKGKGSVCEMMAAGLIGCGIRTGLYTSPHLVDIRERLRVDGQWIALEHFARSLDIVLSAERRLDPQHGPATYFELLTAMAFVHFREMHVQVAVIEVGLGGRLDSTNVLAPPGLAVTAITAIHLEHTQILGNTLGLIAAEKAGIIKSETPVLTIPQEGGDRGEIVQAFRKQAVAHRAPLHIVSDDWPVEINHAARRVAINGDRVRFEAQVPLPGAHQAMNTVLVLAIAATLKRHAPNLPISPSAFSRGLERTPRDGRVEVLSRSPLIVADGAHTRESILALLDALPMAFSYRRLAVIFGCAADKDAKGMIAPILDRADRVIFTKAIDNPRGNDAAELQTLAQSLAQPDHAERAKATTSPSVADAIDMLSADADSETLILATGSFYIAGEAKAWASARQPTDSRQPAIRD